MAFTVVQTHDSLQLVNDLGEMTELFLPAGISLRTNTPPRWALFDRMAILVNTPDQPLMIDGNGTVRLLSPRAPRTGAVLSAQAGGTLSGTYSGVRYTFITVDEVGNLLSESDYSPISTGTAVLTNQFLRAANLDTSPDAITGRRLYRPTSNGSTLFQWLDLDGNILTQVQDDLSDAGLSLTASPILGTPPYLTHIASFRGRLFGAGPEDLDRVRYTEAGIRWAWPSDNLLEIPVKGSDATGITGFLQRREALGVGRQNQLVQITGTGTEDTDVRTIDLDVVIVSKEIGITSQESVDVYRDTGFFLWQDGVYRWGPDGLECVSDGRADGIGNVRSWFASDDYFDRSRFSEAFGLIDPARYKYRLFLYDPAGNLLWVELDLKDGTWWGPHKTTHFIPKSAFPILLNNVRVPIIGGTDGEMYQQWETRTDGKGTGADIAHAIPFHVIGKRHDMGEADPEKFFGAISVFGAAQAAGNVAVISKVGELNATRAKTQYHQMTKTRSNLGILGVGKHAQIEFTHETKNQEIELYGYEINPVHIVGTR